MGTHNLATGRSLVRKFSSNLASLPASQLSSPLSPPKYIYRFKSRVPDLIVMQLTRNDILRLFELLNNELSETGTRGELFLVGGAVMCLAHGARASTRDVDAAYRPSAAVRQAAARVAHRIGIEPDWLNEGVKGFMSGQGDFAPFLELDHLRVMLAEPRYLLAMKCMAMRLGAESRDQDDVRFLLRLLDVRSFDEALGIITKYYPLEQIPQKTLYTLPELLPKQD
jgi:hypothetical protein